MSAAAKIAEERGILFHNEADNEAIHKVGGIAMKYKGEYGIAVDKNIPPHMKEFVEAHELGHIVLGHLESDMTNEQRKKAEFEANLFAVMLQVLDAAGLTKKESVEK